VTPSRSLAAALWPLAAAYEGITRLRAGLYQRDLRRQRRLVGTVISVGNLTVGGTGKTPVVLWIAERLVAEGRRTAILTRGYRGAGQKGGARQPVADEVALLQRRLGERVLFGVGKDRYSNGRLLEKQGVNWFILDDGFQHLALARDANILLVDAMNPFGGGRLLPAGRLREPRAAMGRADVVVITRADHAPAVEAIVRRYTNAPIFYAHTELESVACIPGMAEGLAKETWEKMKFLAFCGIGNPAGFFYDLKRWGFNVAGEKAFRDHHFYSATDIAKLQRAGDAAGADALICTEKDVFNLNGALKLRLPLYACQIRMVLKQEDAFWGAVMEAITRNRPAARE
jgi:tetraacyldisaccharide 4'-kinase